MYYYKVFGLTASSHENFNWPLEEIRTPPEIACEIVQSLDPIVRGKLDAIYASAIPNPKTCRPKMEIFSSVQGLFLSYADLIQFEIRPGGIRYYLPGPLDPKLFETLLFRAVLVLWLELKGIAVLHASGVVLGGTAIAFMANSATGKSTLAAAFLRSGAKFLTDDIFPIEMQEHGFWARPSYAWLRLLPQAAEALGYRPPQNNGNDSEKFVLRLDESYGKFHPDPAPLAALYLVERRDDIQAASVETLPRTQAYLGLLQHTFAGKWLIKSPLTALRMEFLARLIKEVPIKRLVYPSGYEHLSAVVEAVNRDLGL